MSVVVVSAVDVVVVEVVSFETNAALDVVEELSEFVVVSIFVLGVSMLAFAVVASFVVPSAFCGSASRLLCLLATGVADTTVNETSCLDIDVVAVVSN